jgi:hypothetical protein
MKRLHKTGLPQFDQASFDRGLSDGFRGHVWWPGPEFEPLSYTSGYEEARAEHGLKRAHDPAPLPALQGRFPPHVPR